MVGCHGSEVPSGPGQRERQSLGGDLKIAGAGDSGGGEVNGRLKKEVEARRRDEGVTKTARPPWLICGARSRPVKSGEKKSAFMARL